MSRSEAKGIWRRLNRTTQHTRHAAYTACAVADYPTQLSRAGVIWCIRDRLTDTANIGNNSLHLISCQRIAEDLLGDCAASGSRISQTV